MIFRKFLGLVDLSKAQDLDIHKSSMIVIVAENEKLIFTTFQVMITILEGLNDAHKFLSFVLYQIFTYIIIVKKEVTKFYWPSLLNIEKS